MAPIEIVHSTQSPSDDGGSARGPASSQDVIIIFNDRGGPTLVQEIVERMHAFCSFEVLETSDELGNMAWVQVIGCETATPDQLFELIGNRLPDYIRARRFPPSRLAALRAGTL